MSGFADVLDATFAICAGVTLHMDVPTLTNSGGLLLVCALVAFALSGIRVVRDWWGQR